MKTLLQQIKALLQSVGSSFCPDHSDWFGVEAGGTHSRNADRSVLTKFLHAHPADFSTTKLQVRPLSNLIFLLRKLSLYEFLTLDEFSSAISLFTLITANALK